MNVVATDQYDNVVENLSADLVCDILSNNGDVGCGKWAKDGERQ